MQLSWVTLLAFGSLTLATPIANGNTDISEQADESFLTADVYEQSLVDSISDAADVEDSKPQGDDDEDDDGLLPGDPADASAELDGKGGGGKGARSGKGGKPKAGRKNRVTCKGGMFPNFEKCHTPLSYCSDGHYHPYKDVQDTCHQHCSCVESAD
ncbi:hypothetical protein VFPBJ_01264 [Purpureocillium lilacinum]|uniref:Uncharacterized protein n=1 Tax=Purpureocillium lilacinum TaxID=33203 RepID=A0A179HAQ0_PURLI|nr:hypothetical protein VFPBJ_01264 [Purpureocillium lilacinum]